MNNTLQTVFIIIIILMMGMNFYLVTNTAQPRAVEQPTTKVEVIHKQDNTKVDIVTDVNVIPKVQNAQQIDLVLKVDIIPTVKEPIVIPNTQTHDSNKNNNQQVPRSALDSYLVTAQQANMRLVADDALVLRKANALHVSFYSWESVQEDDNIHSSIDTDTRQLFNKLLNEKSGIVVDIGARSGFYGLMGAAYGHKVLAFEPQPSCRTWIATSVQVNGFNDQYWLFPNVVSNTKSKVELELQTSCNEFNWPLLNHTTQRTVKVSTISVDEVMDLYFAENPEEPIWMLRIAAEGAEQRVVQSARKLLASKLVKNVLIEVNAAKWESNQLEHTGEIQAFDYLSDQGYLIRCNVFGTLLEQNPLTRQEYADWLSTFGYSSHCWAQLP